MAQSVKVKWIDSITPGVIGTKIFRDDVLIGTVGNGIQLWEDLTAVDGIEYKYEVQAFTSTGETTKEVLTVNVDYITVEMDTPPTTYVFDGGVNSYMLDKAVTATMMDGIVAQTIIVRVKRTINDHQHGIIGSVGGNFVKIEVDANDNNADCSFQDTGLTAFTNASLNLDNLYHIYALYYDGAEIGLYEDGVQIKFNADPDFVGRIAGRQMMIGAANLDGVAGYLNGEVSDMQFYSRKLTEAELIALNTDLTDLPADNATSLRANFAGQKTTNGAFAGDWTSEVGGYVMENKGTVTFNV